MIRAVFILSSQGGIRLSKFYEKVPVAQQKELISTLYSLLSKRKPSQCNFLDDKSLNFWSGPTKIVYRVYVSLFFIFCVDETESELGILDLIHSFVQTLGASFGEVTETELVLHPDRMYYILDEMVMGGMALETNVQKVQGFVAEMDLLDKNS